jgi:hypothetical protein
MPWMRLSSVAQSMRVSCATVLSAGGKIAACLRASRAAGPQLSTGPADARSASLLGSGAACRTLAVGPCLGVVVDRQVAPREGDDVTSPRRVRSEDAMKADERMTRGRDESAESRKKLSRGHHAMRLVTARILDAVSDVAIREHAEALEAERGSGAVAQ